MWRCIRCETNNDDQKRFCIICGTARVAANAGAENPPDPVSTHISQGSDEAILTAPAAAEAKSGKAKHLIRKWPVLIAGAVFLLAAAGLLRYPLLNLLGLLEQKNTLFIEQIEVTERSEDAITVLLTTEESPDRFEVICTDAYGNVSRQAYVPGQPNTFTGLASGTQYSFSVQGFKDEHIAGAVPYNASTKTTTRIVSLTIGRETVSELELTFIPDGTEPEEWAVSYGPVGQERAAKVFTGHTVVLTGLKPDTAYEVTLQNPSDIQLTGITSAFGHTLASVEVGQVFAELSKSTAVVTWTFEGETPASWNVATTGSEGYTDNQTVLDSTVTLENLQAGETYTLVITCDNMLNGTVTSFIPDALAITEIAATPNEAGGLDISWSCEADAVDTDWLVVYTLEGGSGMSGVVQTSKQSVTLDGLIPGATYTIEIQEAGGKKVSGKATIQVTLPTAKDSHSVGGETGTPVQDLDRELEEGSGSAEGEVPPPIQDSNRELEEGSGSAEGEVPPPNQSEWTDEDDGEIPLPCP